RQKVLIAQIDLGLGRSEKGMGRLRDVIAQARKGGWTALEFDARLAHGRAQQVAGDTAGARRTLESLEAEATPRGMLRIARLAREARQREEGGPESALRRVRWRGVVEPGLRSATARSRRSCRLRSAGTGPPSAPASPPPRSAGPAAHPAS